MSAFIVSQETMTAIVSHIGSGGPYGRELRRGTAFDEYHGRHPNLTHQEIGDILYGLNARAVNGRYRCDDPAPTYSPAPGINPAAVSLPALYKAVSCLRYQCSEDATEGDPLMLDLEVIGQRVAADIIRALPAYQAASWG